MRVEELVARGPVEPVEAVLRVGVDEVLVRVLVDAAEVRAGPQDGASARRAGRSVPPAPARTRPSRASPRTARRVRLRPTRPHGGMVVHEIENLLPAHGSEWGPSSSRLSPCYSLASHQAPALAISLIRDRQSLSEALCLTMAVRPGRSQGRPPTRSTVLPCRASTRPQG